MSKRILIVEDDDSIVYVLKTLLSENGYSVVSAGNGLDALYKISEVDLVILDLGLPDMDGQNVLKSIRKSTQKPVLVLSARAGEDEKVKAFENGADDYVTKPFGNSELLARIYTAFRHCQEEKVEMYKHNDLFIDLKEHIIRVDEKIIHLTMNEFKIVSLLVQNSGKLMSYEALMEHVWGPYSVGDNKILRVNMANIRRKLEKNPTEPEYIMTEIGVGYRMKENQWKAN